MKLKSLEEEALSLVKLDLFRNDKSSLLSVNWQVISLIEYQPN